MSKQAYKDARIILGGVDVSDTVVRWSVGAKIGHLYVAKIDLIKTDQLKIAKKGEYLPGGRRVVTVNDVITVGGVDISKWIARYQEITRVRKSDEVRLFVQADKDVLSINGTHPWEFAE